MERPYTPLSQLTDDCHRWKVCVRLDKKFPVTTFTNKATGREGAYCTFQFIDSEGTRISAIAFDEQCTKYYKELRMGSAYCISRCHVQQVRCVTARSPGPLEFVFGPEMQLDEKKADDTDFPSFPTIKLSNVNEILSLKPGACVNFVASVKKADDLCNNKTKSGLVVPMRKIELFDSSTDETTFLTLWGPFAEDFDPNVHKKVAVHDGKTVAFGGIIRVQCAKETIVVYNPSENSNGNSNFLSGYSNGDTNVYEAMDVDELILEIDNLLVDDSSQPTGEKPKQEEVAALAENMEYEP